MNAISLKNLPRLSSSELHHCTCAHSSSINEPFVSLLVVGLLQSIGSNKMDFVNKLDTDTLLSILSCLDDPSDLVRASAVSRSWRDFGKDTSFNCFLVSQCN